MRLLMPVAFEAIPRFWFKYFFCYTIFQVCVLFRVILISTHFCCSFSVRSILNLNGNGPMIIKQIINFETGFQKNAFVYSSNNCIVEHVYFGAYFGDGLS